MTMGGLTGDGGRMIDRSVFLSDCIIDLFRHGCRLLVPSIQP